MELLLVMAIIGILAGIIFISIGPARKRARVTAFKKAMQDVTTAATLCADSGGDVQAATADGTANICNDSTIVGNVPFIKECYGGSSSITGGVTLHTDSSSGDNFVLSAQCSPVEGSIICYAYRDMNGCKFSHDSSFSDTTQNGCPKVK